jgi:DNA-binding beta-propeller fold protein YncE/predicted GH43/DUF377 family glycosyl hydrolase
MAFKVPVPRLLVLSALVLGGCIRDAGPGPFVGDCAEYPDGLYTWGDIGIGTCLSSPSTIEFFEKDGETWLAVVNADVYRNFSGGSVTLIDWASVDRGVTRQKMTDIAAFRVNTTPFVGGFGWVPGLQRALVPSRYSEDGRTRSYLDQVHVLDLSDPRDPKMAEQGDVEVFDDPFHVVVDETSGEAYVLNLTDHSLSVLNVGDDPIVAVDLAPKFGFDDLEFDDADDSRTNAELTDLKKVDDKAFETEDWTLSFIEGSWRLWVPEESGLVRYVSSDGVAFSRSPYGVELDAAVDPEIDEVADPFFRATEDGLAVYFADQGEIKVAVTVSPSTTWFVSDETLLTGSGEMALLSSPTVAVIEDDRQVMLVDGRPAEGEPAAIGLARSDDGVTWDLADEPVLSPSGAFVSFEDPTTFVDSFSGDLEVYLSAWDGQRWSIGHSSSTDRATFRSVEAVLSLPDGHIGAPWVSFANGRYRMVAAISEDGALWRFVRSSSIDGLTWTDPEELDLEPIIAESPPRVGIQAQSTLGWRLEGADSGPVDVLAYSGSSVVSGLGGFEFSVAAGHEIDLALGGSNTKNGMDPGSFVTHEGERRLYYTGTGADDRERIGILAQDAGGRWRSLVTNLFPPETVSGGASDPLVFADGSGWVMLYSFSVADDQKRIHRATSPDGLTWTITDKDVVPSPDPWDEIAQEPHSIETLDDGTLRLWYAGDNGSRSRIGSAVTTDLGQTFEPEPQDDQPFQFATGQPGDFDDSGVADPLFVKIGDEDHLYFSGFDGSVWSIGHAVREGGEWVRTQNTRTGLGQPALTRQGLTFSTGGARTPVLVGQSGRTVEVLYAGTDGRRGRIGRARGAERLYAEQEVATSGDLFRFHTQEGDPEISPIQVGQITESFSLLGVGLSGLTQDRERGFLYVPSKLSNTIYVVDTRDDSGPGFNDANAMDLDGVIRVDTLTGVTGFRELVIDEKRDRLYAIGRSPDSIVVIDRSKIPDNEFQVGTDAIAIGSLPLRTSGNDAGVKTLSVQGATGLALAHGGDHLLVCHSRENSVAVYDLNLGQVGEQIAWIPAVGENPSSIRVSPDGKWAVVANYLGDVTGNFASSTLAVIDLDENSETYLEVVTWLVND